MRKGVLTYSEAQTMWLVSLMADPRLEWQPLPESLWPAASRLHLLEMPQAGSRQ